MADVFTAMQLDDPRVVERFARIQTDDPKYKDAILVGAEDHGYYWRLWVELPENADA